jgi:hypothetical protein
VAVGVPKLDELLAVAVGTLLHVEQAVRVRHLDARRARLVDLLLLREEGGAPDDEPGLLVREQLEVQLVGVIPLCLPALEMARMHRALLGARGGRRGRRLLEATQVDALYRAAREHPKRLGEGAAIECLI